MAAADPGHPDGTKSQIFARIRRNVGWLASSTGFAAVTSIAYTAVTARALGPRGFGAYALILTYAQLIGSFVQFDSWASVIRFGSAHIANKQSGRLARLFGFTAVMDWLSAAVGIAIALVLVPFIAPYLHWSPLEALYASWFGAILLLTTGSTATGILRLFNRFDLLAFADSVGPMTRLLGAIACMWVGAGLLGFLGVWALAAVLQLLAQWAMALSLGQRLVIGPKSARTVTVENHRIVRFMLKTNLASSINQFWLQCGTLTVGWVSGPVDAGGFRIAYRFAQALTKPVNMVTRALFPEFARLVASRDHAAVRAVLSRVTIVAASFAGVVLLVVGLAGPQILRLIAGPSFTFAQRFFFLLTIAAAIDLSGFALVPFHNAHGRAGRVLRSGVVAVLVYAALIAFLSPILGARGVAWASIGASLAIFGQLAQSTWQIIHAVNKEAPKHSAGEALVEGTDLVDESFQ